MAGHQTKQQQTGCGRVRWDKKIGQEEAEDLKRYGSGQDRSKWNVRPRPKTRADSIQDKTELRESKIQDKTEQNNNNKDCTHICFIRQARQDAREDKREKNNNNNKDCTQIC